jgi:hypothetical protein
MVACFSADLQNCGNSDVMILVIGFKAGSLLPDDSGSTYTSAEYEELLRLGKEPLVFADSLRRFQAGCWGLSSDRPIR